MTTNSNGKLFENFVDAVSARSKFEEQRDLIKRTLFEYLAEEQAAELAFMVLQMVTTHSKAVTMELAEQRKRETPPDDADKRDRFWKWRSEQQTHLQNIFDDLDKVESLETIEKDFCQTHSQRNAAAQLMRVIRERIRSEASYLSYEMQHINMDEIPF